MTIFFPSILRTIIQPAIIKKLIQAQISPPFNVRSSWGRFYQLPTKAADVVVVLVKVMGSHSPRISLRPNGFFLVKTAII